MFFEVLIASFIGLGVYDFQRTQKQLAQQNRESQEQQALLKQQELSKKRSSDQPEQSTQSVEKTGTTPQDFREQMSNIRSKL